MLRVIRSPLESPATSPLKQPHLLNNYIFNALRSTDMVLITPNQHVTRKERVNIFHQRTEGLTQAKTAS